MHLFHEGRFVGPFVYPYAFTFNLRDVPARLRGRPHEAAADPLPLPRRDYEFWGMIAGGLPSRLSAGGRHDVPARHGQAGARLFSRIIYGARISLTVGLIGIAVSFVLGLILGGLAGYIGGWVDYAVQRLIEILRSLPELPLWLALSAALPPNWSPMLVFFGITLILGLLDWPGLARAVRSKLLSLREEDFVRAAELMGASTSGASSCATSSPTS